MERYKLLRAVEYNGARMWPGEWEKVTWSVFSDGTYRVKIEYKPDWDERNQEEFIVEPSRVNSGTMDKEKFDNLKELLAAEKWRDPDRVMWVEDGVMWKIEYYSPDGEILNSSGEIDHIDGEEILERIAWKLPKPDVDYSGKPCKPAKRKKRNK